MSVSNCVALRALVALIALGLPPAARAASYHVGNSLTWDGLGHQLPSGAMAISQLAASAGLSYEPAYHIRCSWPLPAIWADPTSTCVPSPAPGRFAEALPAYDWEFVTLQPHVGTTLAQDAEAVLNFIDLTCSAGRNDATVFYVYQTWPQTVWGSYDDVWETPVADEDAADSAQRRDYFTHLYARVDAATDAPVRLIPAGEVLFALHEKWEAGQLPGVASFDEFYRDSIHLSGLGSYAAQATILAATRRVNPLTLSDPAFNPETIAAVNATIWEVLQADLRVGQSDFNADGVTDGADLALWDAGDALADADWNGIVDGADFLAWQRELSPVVLPAASVAAIPEPATGCLWLVGLLGYPGRRRPA